MNLFEDQFCIHFRSKAEQRFRFQHLVLRFYPFLFLLLLLNELCLYYRVQPNKIVCKEKGSNSVCIALVKCTYLVNTWSKLIFKKWTIFRIFPFAFAWSI